MAPPQSAQKQMPVRRVGPLTMRDGVTLGLRTRRLIDQRGHLDGDDLAGGFQHLVLGALVELVTADIGRPCQMR
jgi:hypothetical protein